MLKNLLCSSLLVISSTASLYAANGKEYSDRTYIECEVVYDFLDNHEASMTFNGYATEVNQVAVEKTFTLGGLTANLFVRYNREQNKYPGHLLIAYTDVKSGTELVTTTDSALPGRVLQQEVHFPKFIDPNLNVLQFFCTVNGSGE